MNRYGERTGTLAIRLLRVREAVEKVEEKKLSLQQLQLRETVVEQEQAQCLREQLQQATLGASAGNRSMLHHQWLALSKLEERKLRKMEDVRRSVDAQRSRVTEVHVESERWRMFHQRVMDGEKTARRIEEQKQLDEAAITRFSRKELEDGDDSIM